MIAHMSAHIFLASLISNVLLASTATWAFVLLRSERNKKAHCEQAVADLTSQLHSEKEEHARTQQELGSARDFIASIYPLFRQAAGEGARDAERYRYFRETTLLLWEQIKEQAAAKQREAKFDLGYKIVEAILSHVVPCPKHSPVQ